MQLYGAQMVKAAVNSIETLDVALKTREPAGAVKMLAQDVADRIAVVIGGLQARTYPHVSRLHKHTMHGSERCPHMCRQQTPQTLWHLMGSSPIELSGERV